MRAPHHDNRPVRREPAARPAALALVLALFAALAQARAPSATLVWISVDGLRPDYLERAPTEFFDRGMAEGAFSLSLIPPFPSLTFPAHATKATGAGADLHGITGNVIYDSGRDRSYAYPNFPWLLEAEPIWTTATRQGAPVAVFGWPLSHRQAGQHAARYFDQQYDRDQTDAQRLERVLSVWRAHTVDPPLRLVMGYIVGPDAAGHRHGPDAAATAEATAKADALLAAFEREMLAIWESRRAPGDELFLLVTGDHGMSAVHTLVNARICAGLPARGSPVRRASGGNIHHFFLNRIDDAAERARVHAEIIANLRRYDFLEVYERDGLPDRWNFRHPRRTGDIVAIAARGYAFDNRIRTATMASAERAEPLLGMHGYCAAANPEMRTVALLRRYPEPLGGHDLGEIAMDRLHATAARILGVEAAASARADPIPIPMPAPME